MAIDTLNKQLSVLNLGLVWHPNTIVSPGTIGEDDRQQFLWGYPGILYSGGTPPGGAGESVYPILMRRRRR